MDDHKDDRRVLAERFVHVEWENLAAFAWRKYLELGRGAVKAAWVTARAFIEGDRSPYWLHYVTVHPDGEPDALLARLVGQYDPKRQIVTMFVDDTGVLPLEPLDANGRGRTVWIEGPQWIWIANGAVSPPDAQAKRAN